MSVPPKDPTVTKDSEPQPVTLKPKRHYIRWSLLVLFLIAVIWAAISDNPFAQGLRDLAGSKPDQPILDNSFTVAAHSFRYYKASLPADSVNVEILGHFSVAPGDQAVNDPNAMDADDPDRNNIEVYVLGEEAFSGWQRGLPTSSLYASEKASQGTVRAELPAGAGTYYIIFSNRFSPKSAKKVQASVRLHYKSWLPDWLRRTASRRNT